MSFSSLEINPDVMREFDPNLFTASNYNDAAMIALSRTVALDDLESRSKKLFQLDGLSNADARLDSFAADYEEAFVNALMHAQLMFFYGGNIDFQDDGATHKQLIHRKQYENALERFKNFNIDGYAYATTSLIRRS